MRLRLSILSVVAAAIAAVPAGAGAGKVQLTPIARLPFPERGYVVDLPPGAAVGAGAVTVRENGRPVRQVDVAPVGAAGIHSGVILALDASESMAGKPIAAAVAAAVAFAEHRVGGQQVGVVAFNGDVHVLLAPSPRPRELRAALAGLPSLAYGTRIYDAVDRSLALLAAARVATGSIVLLSDGADIGSDAAIADVLAKARARNVRIFTVGLRSGAFEPRPLRRLAAGSGGSYVEAASAAQLAPLYAAVGHRLAREYVVRYRSDAAPRSRVRTTVSIDGVGVAAESYRAPTPAGLAPFHRSALSRFLLSPGAVVVLSLLVALLTAVAVGSVVRPRRNAVVGRVAQFTGHAANATPAENPAEARSASRRLNFRGGWYAKLERDVELARIEMPARKIVLLTLAGTAGAVIVLALLSPVFAVLGLLTPLVTKSLIARKLRQVRDSFADQLAPNLQVLASALRVGHSFVGALTVVVDNAHEPSRGELRRVLTDERLGVPIEEAVRRVAVRMASRDFEQVALLAELQRTAGGNAAEVLDTVVATVRERADLRRLIRTLTAQGRMARWILTGLPVLTGLAVWLLQGELMRPLFESSGGQVALVIAALMVISGSLVIQRLVEIKV